MNFDLAYMWDALPRLLEGAWMTVQVSFLAFFCAIGLAIAITLLRRLHPPRQVLRDPHTNRLKQFLSKLVHVNAPSSPRIANEAQRP